MIHKLIFAILLWSMFLGGCGSVSRLETSTPSITPTQLTQLESSAEVSKAPSSATLVSTNPPGIFATPASDSPASGICAESEGDIVIITFNVDVPDPRCAIVRPDQKLTIINNREETVEASLGLFKATLPSKTEVIFDL